MFHFIIYINNFEDDIIIYRKRYGEIKRCRYHKSSNKQFIVKFEFFRNVIFN